MQLVRMERSLPARFSVELDKAPVNTLGEYIQCILINGHKFLTCSLLETSNIDYETGIIVGFIKLHNHRKLAELLTCKAIPTFNNKYQDISTIYHTYGFSFKYQSLSLKINKWEFDYIELNRYKEYDSIFKFIGRVNIDILDEFLIYAKEANNGRKDTKSIKGRNN